MIEIIKRLEIIKSSILIEDIEIIELQIMKLSSQNIDVDVKNIILKLENSEYSLALDLIENYISQHTGLVLYEDKELLSLKFELKQLEIKFQDLLEEKTEYLNELEEFNAIAFPVLEQLNSNKAENKRLSALRDALLPKLMSGELDVSDIDL
jgi:hypothetical protein